MLCCLKRFNQCCKEKRKPNQIYFQQFNERRRGRRLKMMMKNAHTLRHTHTPMHEDTRTYTHALTHARTQTLAHNTHTTRTNTRAHTHAHTYARTNRTRTHTHNAHTHTHTHTQYGVFGIEFRNYKLQKIGNINICAKSKFLTTRFTFSFQSQIYLNSNSSK